MNKNRGKVPFDKDFFSKQFGKKESTIEERFTYIYNHNHWAGNQSLSGQGSEQTQTTTISNQLVEVILTFEIQTMLDLPCGDFNWLKNVPLPLSKYIGADIVQALVQANQCLYTNEQRQFLHLDLIKDPLPQVDLLFCRDCFVHFSNQDILKSLENIRRSHSRYLLTTTFTDCDWNENIVTGDWRIINLNQAPFHFSPPLLLINENCTEGDMTYMDKCLGLWKIEDI